MNTKGKLILMFAAFVWTAIYYSAIILSVVVLWTHILNHNKHDIRWEGECIIMNSNGDIKENAECVIIEKERE